jgi:hypothetical protein
VRRGLLKPLREWLEHAQQREAIDPSQVLTNPAYSETVPVVRLVMEAIKCNAPREVLSMLLSSQQVKFLIRMKMHLQNPEQAIEAVHCHRCSLGV